MARKKKKHIGCLGTLTVFLVIIGGCIGVNLMRNPPDWDAINRQQNKNAKAFQEKHFENLRSNGIYSVFTAKGFSLSTEHLPAFLDSGIRFEASTEWIQHIASSLVDQ